MENKCENCKFAKKYHGWDGYYCEARHYVNCKDFDSQKHTKLWEANN